MDAQGKILSKELRKIIGNDWVAQVNEILEKKYGETYTPSYIRLVVQGIRQNENIQNEVLKLATKLKKKPKQNEFQKELKEVIS